MINAHRWRDQQIGSFKGYHNHQTLLAQEKVMLDFLCQFPQARWLWNGDDNNLRSICTDLVNVTAQDCDGIIIYGNRLHGLTATQLVATVTEYIADKNYVYLAVNRYEIQGQDFAADLPHHIEDAIDFIVKKIHKGFNRLASFPQVDGDHMVFAHPMDCFGLCR